MKKFISSLLTLALTALLPCALFAYTPPKDGLNSGNLLNLKYKTYVTPNFSLAVTTEKKPLKNMIPPEFRKKPSSIKAQLNCSTMEYGEKTLPFNGIFKTADGNVYMNGELLNGKDDPKLANVLTPFNDKDAKIKSYYPIWYYKYGGSSVIKWKTSTQFSVAYPYTNVAFSTGPVLVYNGMNVFEKEVYEKDDFGNSNLIFSYNDKKPQRYNSYQVNGGHTGYYTRSAFGQLRNGKYLILCVTDSITLPTLARLMINLDCINAVTLDGAKASQMVVNGRRVAGITDDIDDYYGTALCAY